jgi:hypothetical protein
MMEIKKVVQKIKFKPSFGISVYDNPNDPTINPWLDDGAARERAAQGIVRRIAAAFAKRWK